MGIANRPSERAEWKTVGFFERETIRWKFVSCPQNLANGTDSKADVVSRAVNYMAMARGPAADYDEWAKRTGDDSWKWKNILPLMREVGSARLMAI